MKIHQTTAATHALQIIAALLIVLVCAPAQAQPNNHSALTQGNQHQFVARLQTPSSPDAGSLLGKTPAATMEYRIVSERLNNRRFFKLIADAIAVNSDAKTLAKNASYISRSRSAVPVELQPNDAIAFVFDGKSTVTMSLNGVQLASYQSADFFRMLLSTWVGDVPISSRFKREILGKDTPEKAVAQLFSDSAPSAERKQAITLALATPAAEAVSQSTVAAATVVAAVAPAVAAAAKAEVPMPAPKVKVAQTPAVKVETKPAVKVESQPAPKAVAAAPVTTTTKAQEATKPTPKAQAKPSAVPTPAVVAIAKPPIQAELSEEEEARRLLLRQEYLKALNRDIKIQKHLPAAAFTRRAEGSVRLAISLDKNGKLLKVEVVEPSRYSMFNEQALEAVGNAQPFTPPPADLESDPFEFETTLYYDLPL